MSSSLSRTAAFQNFKPTLYKYQRNMHVENHINSMGITLPAAPQSKANYALVSSTPSIDGKDIVFVSGHLPIKSDGTLLTGAVGPDSNGCTIEEGYVAARQAGLNIIATLKNYLGDLDRVDQIVKLFGIVQSTNDFKHQHLVMDGCSDIMVEVFGSGVGLHARSAIGTNTLPLDITVEVEAIVRIKPSS